MNETINPAEKISQALGGMLDNMKKQYSNDQATTYIQRLESEIADNHAQWRADQEKINYLLSELETYKVALGAVYEALAPHYEEMGLPH